MESKKIAFVYAKQSEISPLYALLNKLLEEAPGHSKKLISLVFIAAKIAIARSWRSISILFEQIISANDK